MVKKIIELHHINKRFKDKTIFEDAELSVEKGEFLAIKGQSGAGKTTLLNMIGLLEPFQGDYILNDEPVDLKKDTEKVRCNTFSYVFQEPYLIEYKDVYENIVLPLRNKRYKVDEKEVDEILNFLNITELKRRKVYNLSGGERQRVAIARALMSKSLILLADEPTGSLDLDNSEEVMTIFKNINKQMKMTILMVTHSNMFDGFYDRTLFIKDGGILHAK